MSLARKLAKLETVVAAQTAAAPPTFWTPARVEQWRTWVVRLLETMPDPRAMVAYVELTMLPAEQWGPLTRVVDREARLVLRHDEDEGTEIPPLRSFLASVGKTMGC